MMNTHPVDHPTNRDPVIDRLLIRLDVWRSHTTDGELVTAVCMNLAMFCLRCRGDIEPGEPAVVQPGGGIWLHADCAVPPLVAVDDPPADADPIDAAGQLALDRRSRPVRAGAASSRSHTSRSRAVAVANRPYRGRAGGANICCPQRWNPAGEIVVHDGVG